MSWCNGMVVRGWDSIGVWGLPLCSAEGGIQYMVYFGFNPQFYRIINSMSSEKTPLTTVRNCEILHNERRQLCHIHIRTDRVKADVSLDLKSDVLVTTERSKENQVGTRVGGVCEKKRPPPTPLIRIRAYRVEERS